MIADDVSNVPAQRGGAVIRSKLAAYQVVEVLPGGWFAEFDRGAKGAARTRLLYAARAIRTAPGCEPEDVIAGVVSQNRVERVVNDKPRFVGIHRMWLECFDSGTDEDHTLACELAYRAGFLESAERFGKCDPEDEDAVDAAVALGYRLRVAAFIACDRVAAARARGLRHGASATTDLYRLKRSIRNSVARRFMAAVRAWATCGVSLPMQSPGQWGPAGVDFIEK
jgi:hypothetical protein